MMRLERAAEAGCRIFAVFAICASAAAADQIAGTWAAEDRTRGGIGGMLIFAEDGSVTSILGALLDFNYQVEADRIKLTDKKSGKSEGAVEPFEIIGDKLVSNPADPKKREERTRLGAPTEGAPPLIGVWTFQHATGGLATWRYTSCGLAQLSVPMKTAKGRFKQQGQDLIMQFDGEEPCPMKVRIGSSQLTLVSEDGRIERRYTRVCPLQPGETGARNRGR